MRRVWACLSIASSAMRTAWGNHVYRAAEVEGTGDDGSTARVAYEQRAAKCNEDGQAHAGAGFVRVHRPHLDGNSCSRGFRSPTNSLVRVRRFCSPTRTLSRDAGGLA